MPRFFLHLRTGTTTIDQDVQGTEFPSLEAAIAEATQAHMELLRDEGLEGRPDRSHYRFENTDEHEYLVATVPAGDY